MMEQDFDEIGRRLYDLEADPPDDGWKRIGGTLNTTGRVSWLRKNWWKPLVLIMPAIVYLGYSEFNETNSTLKLQADITKFNEITSANQESHVITPSEEEAIASQVPSGSEEQAPDNERSNPAHVDVAPNALDTQRSQKVISDATGRNNISTPLKTSKRTDRKPEDSQVLNTNPITNRGEVLVNKEDGVGIEKAAIASERKEADSRSSKINPITSEVPLDQVTGIIREKVSIVTISTDEHKTDSRIVTTPTNESNTGDSNSSSKKAVGNGEVLGKPEGAGREEASVMIISTYENKASDSRIVNTPASENQTANSRSSNTNSTANTGEVSLDKADGAVLEEDVNIPAQGRISELHNSGDVTAITTEPATHEDDAKLNATTETDSTIVERDFDKSSDDSSPTWRINVSIMPQYVNRRIQPLATDEVFVTKVDGGASPTRTGIEVGMGVARSLSKNWYLDARLSYNNLEQEITHSYSNGEVDTLISVKQTDGNVRVTPVYHVINREIKSDYHYVNLSFGATYYFWSTAKSRFNVSASADMHYLMSVQIKEKINDQWVSINDNSTNKTNFSFTIGAGYNITLYKGLELMIRPSLRYFTNDIKSAELPYKLNQQSVGIHFMLSKTIGKN